MHSKEQNKTNHVSASNILAYCRRTGATAWEERGTDLLVLSSCSSYSCYDCWADWRPPLPSAAATQRSRCRRGRSWGFAEWHKGRRGGGGLGVGCVRNAKAGLCVEAHHVLLDALRQCLMGLGLMSRCSSFYGHKMKTQLNPLEDKHNSCTNRDSFWKISQRWEKFCFFVPLFC